MKMFWSALLVAVSFLTSPPAMANLVWSAPVSLSGTFDVHPCTSGSLVVGGCDGGTFELNVQIPKFFGALAPDQVMMLNSISFLGGFTTFAVAMNALDVKFGASAFGGATFDSVGCSALCSIVTVTSNSSMGSVSATMSPFGGGILAIPNFVASNGNPTGDSSAWLMIAGHGFVGDSTTIVRMTMDSMFQTATVVPEPSSIFLMLAGLALVTWRKWRQR